MGGATVYCCNSWEVFYHIIRTKQTTKVEARAKTCFRQIQKMKSNSNQSTASWDSYYLNIQMFSFSCVFIQNLISSWTHLCTSESQRCLSEAELNVSSLSETIWFLGYLKRVGLWREWVLKCGTPSPNSLLINEISLQGEAVCEIMVVVSTTPLQSL